MNTIFSDLKPRFSCKSTSGNVYHLHQLIPTPIFPLPPERAIISGSGFITENISIYVDHHIKNLATQHPSFLQDTPHLLRIIHKINEVLKLPENAMLVTTDVIGAYLNIPQEAGSAILKEALEEREDK